MDSHTAISGAVSASQLPSTSNVNIGQRPSRGFNFNGRIDDVRIYPRALTPSEVRTDMNTPLGGSTDTSPPSVAITAPAVNAQVSDIVTITADAALARAKTADEARARKEWWGRFHGVPCT